MTQSDFRIGTKYVTQGKHPRVCTVVDILKTYNHRGELVSTRYVATHEFCGQLVRESDVVATTIARGFISDK